MNRGELKKRLTELEARLGLDDRGVERQNRAFLRQVTDEELAELERLIRTDRPGAEALWGRLLSSYGRGADA